MKETAAHKKARLIRLLHVAKSQLQMDDAAYRTLLANASRGKTSSKAMGADELETALRMMKAQGFVVTLRQPENGRKDLPVRDYGAQVAMIRGLWLELHQMGAVRSPSELSLARFVKRMTGTDHHGWLDADNASKVVEHLKQWKQREEAKHGG